MVSRRSFMGGAVALGIGPAASRRASVSDFAAEFESLWSRHQIYMLQVVDAMPAEHYGFRPVPEVFSYAEQLLHIAQSSFGIAGTIRGKPIEDLPDFGAEGKSRDEIREIVDQSLNAMRDAVIAQSDDELDRRVPWGRPLGVDRSISLRGAALSAWHHGTHHRGQLVVYLRLNGIVPPAYSD
jgi:uncharacterized damage-inducible protein DinB